MIHGERARETESPESETGGWWTISQSTSASSSSVAVIDDKYRQPEAQLTPIWTHLAYATTDTADAEF